jgi:hypothetical protein
MDRVDSIESYDYKNTAALPDVDLAKSTMPTFDFLAEYNSSSTAHRHFKVLADYSEEHEERIQIINACQQETAKLSAQNVFGEMLRKNCRRKRLYEVGMRSCLRQADFDILETEIREDFQRQMEDLKKVEERQIQVLENFRTANSQEYFQADRSTSVCDGNEKAYVSIWNKYNTLGRDINGFFRIVDEDRGVSCFEKIVAKSLGRSQVRFRPPRLFVKTVDDESDVTTTESEDSEDDDNWGKAQQKYRTMLSKGDETLSNECISISEENKLLTSEVEKEGEETQSGSEDSCVIAKRKKLLTISSSDDE